MARRVVVFPFEGSADARFWLTRDYLPEFGAFSEAWPGREAAGSGRVEPVLIPWDCADGFYCSSATAEAYLDDRCAAGFRY